MSNLSSSSRSATISASTEFILSFYMIETILFYSPVATPASSHQRFQTQRSITESNSKKLKSGIKIQPAREVSLRVKFIRLGEVSFLFLIFVHSSISITKKEQYIA